jgi:XTP/dITP diphosphohydrolase
MNGMKEITMATTNEAKVAQIRGALAPIGIAVNGVRDKSLLPEVIEDGATAQVNARKKAIIYADALGQTVLSMDNALYLDGLSDTEQPGVHVRRINGVKERPSDEELIAHYSEVVRKLGDRITGRWEFAICVATPDGTCHETTIISSRIFTSEASKNVVAGYPLESIQIDPTTGRYIAEMAQAEQDAFWQQAIGAKLQEFMRSF